MSRRNASRRNNSAGKPAWVWFVLGNFVGGFVVFIIFLNGLKHDQAPSSAHRPPAPAKQQAEDKSDAPRFDFYTLLKENEVSVPPPKDAKLARHNSKSPAEEPGVRPSRDPQMTYILQAASFRDKAEAEKLRARLMLANLDVKVESNTDSRGTWNRVLVGPYENSSEVSAARETLANMNLMPLVLKRPLKSQ
ncbi:SPOR domain-containing protein [Microbulbifer hainanensis]|uniref:SPOR domain-containing protein n=1 Tax=Microbulbifer hainanensis TaxID=2735675 RepID=UPI001868ACD0|nr:SPOR domain-containing protein [Microbulbifer hainanensis]